MKRKPDPLRNQIGYVKWHNEAERRNLRGERQVQCEKCGLWVFLKWREDVKEHKRRCKLMQAERAKNDRGQKNSTHGDGTVLFKRSTRRKKATNGTGRRRGRK